MIATALEILLPLIKEFEGCRLKAYLCPAGVWTIGWGCTEGVKPGMVWSREEAEQALLREIAKHEAAVAQLHEAQKLETLGQLTGGVAHDFNNILQTVSDIAAVTSRPAWPQLQIRARWRRYSMNWSSLMAWMRASMAASGSARSASVWRHRGSRWR